MEPPRRPPSQPRRPVVITEREATTVPPPARRQTPSPAPLSPRHHDDPESVRRSERDDGLREEIRRAVERAQEKFEQATIELAEVYEHRLEERDDEIERLKEHQRQATTADLDLNEALSQLRKDNTALRTEITNLRAESGAVITAAVTAEVSRRFTTTAEVHDIAKGEGRGSKIVSGIVAIVTALAASGAFAAIAKSCNDPPKEPSLQLTKPVAQPKPGYGSMP